MRDYTARLATALTAAGVDVTVTETDGRFDAHDAEVVHLQYPARAFGRSLIPWRSLAAARGRRRTVVVTLHEHSIAHVLRRTANQCARIADHLVFTTESELVSFRADRRRSSVIPIGANVASSGRSLDQRLGARRIGHVICFGRLDHRSGDLARAVQLGAAIHRIAPSVVLTIAGSARSGWPVPSGLASNTRLRLNAEESEIAALLAEADAALLPYGDGASERRGSLLACLQSGIPVFTEHGPATPPWLRHTTVDLLEFTDLADQAARVIAPLSSHPVADPAHRRELEFELGRRRWGAIAEAHLEVYERLSRSR